jgi:hypothetical protein
MPVAPERATAAKLLQSAVAALRKAELKELSPSDRSIVSVALKKLATIARSLSSSNPLSDDDVAARLAAVASALTNCHDKDLKRDIGFEVSQAATIFNVLSLS